MATILRVRASIAVNAGASTALTTFYWDSTGAALGALATESVARVRAAYAALAAIIGGGSTYTPNLLVDEIDENTGAIVNQVTAAAPAALSFTGVGNFLPLQTQALVQYQTALFIGGRRVRGRTYIPGFTASQSSAGGNLIAGATTALGNFNTALGATIVTATNQRVWHRPSRTTGTGGLSAVVATRTASPSFAVMRSRRR